MRVLFLFFLLAVMPFAVKAEGKQVYLKIALQTYDEDKGVFLENRKVEVYEDGKLAGRLLTARDGRVFYTFTTGHVYELKVLPEEGYISKTVVFDTRNIDLDHWKYRNREQVNISYDVQLKLFRSERCEDFAFLNSEPIIHYVYKAGKGDLADIAKPMQKRIKRERRKNCEKEIAVF